MDCKTCKSKRIQQESEAMRQHKVIKWLVIVNIIMFLAFAGSNVAWMVYENQFVDTEQTIEAEQSGDGVNIVGGGDVDYGTESEDNNTHTN